MFSICIFLLFLFTPLIFPVTTADEARLVILPEGENIIRSIGANIVLTCKGLVPDPDLITNLRWLGPDGHDLPNGDR